MKKRRNEKELVLSAIVAIEKMNVFRLKPRAITISSFIKGTERSPYYEYYKKYPQICGKMNISPKKVKEICKELIEEGVILENITRGRNYYSACSKDSSFISNCSPEEMGLINRVKKYVKTKIVNVEFNDKPNRYTITDIDNNSADGINYAWMWFVRINGVLFFRYKKNQNDSHKAEYEKNNIAVNELQFQTIINIIDYIVG